MGPGQDLHGRTAIVTGAGSGIGRAIARLLASAGAAVVVADINADGAHTTTAEIEADRGKALTLIGDLGDDNVVLRVVTDTAAHFGGIDVLVNNAGIMDSMAPPARVATQEWERVLRVNLTAPFLLTRADLPHMLAKGGGAIVNIASGAGLHGGIAGVSYTASKHGLVGLTRSVAYAYRAAGIRCNAIAPGPVVSNIGSSASIDPEGAALFGPVHALASAVPVAQPEQIASAVLFLASDAASNISGVILPTDGGFAAI
jgi:NAD(P)-dependent dehydrogenase (short-subunit alcohol dehydrogenase family)